MEHGTLPPRRDVAEKLADVLGLERQLLIEWSSMRVSPHLPSDVLERRERYDAALRDAWDTNSETIVFASRPSFDQDAAPTLERRALSAMSRLARSMHSDHSSLPVPAGRFSMEELPPSRDSDPAKITVYPAGVDPDRFRGEPAGYVDRAQVETLVQGQAELIRPIAYLVPLQDLERLRRSSFPSTPPTCAVVSRPLPVVIDSREPYAIRFRRTVILAYCGWNGRELVVLDPPGRQGFVRLKARKTRALEQIVVGQVVALSWFPIE